jgi:hypothetical protein
MSNKQRRRAAKVRDRSFRDEMRHQDRRATELRGSTTSKPFSENRALAKLRAELEAHGLAALPAGEPTAAGEPTVGPLRERVATRWQDLNEAMVEDRRRGPGPRSVHHIYQGRPVGHGRGRAHRGHGGGL